MIRKRENNNSISNNRNDVFKNKRNDDGNNESIKV